MNVQARELGLGSGGFDILYANLTRGLDLPSEPGAHVMKLPYTPLQAAVRHGEEDGTLAETLAGMPVVCCSLHSQLAPVCAGIGAGVRVAYVQVPGGALPVSLSDAVRALKERGLLETAVAAGACVDGDVACVSVASALAWAARRRVRGGRVRDRARDRRHRLVARPRRRRGGGGGERRERARRAPGARRARLGRRPARAPPRRLAPHEGGARALSRQGGGGLAQRARGARVARAAGAGGRERLGGRLRGPAAVAHGSRPRRGSVVLRGRVRGRPARAGAGSCDGGAPARPGRRPRHLEHVRGPARSRRRGRRRRASTRASASFDSSPMYGEAEASLAAALEGGGRTRWWRRRSGPRRP